MRSFFVTAMLAGVLAAGAACGGDSEPTPTVVPQAALVPTSTPVPTRAAGPSPTPTLSDLLDRVPGRFVSLEEIESGSAFGDQIGPALEEFGWITQYRNSFTRGTTFLASSLSLFSTSVGAAGWFTWLPEGVQNIEEASAEEFKYSTSRSFGLDPESIAVDYAPLRLKSTAQSMFGVRITAEFTGMTNRVWWVCILEKEVVACVAILDRSVEVGTAQEAQLLTELSEVMAFIDRKAKANGLRSVEALLAGATPGPTATPTLGGY